MKADEVIKQRIADLVEKGKGVVKSNSNWSDSVDAAAWLGWTTQARHFLETTIGSDTVYSRAFQDVVDRDDNRSLRSFAQSCQSILESLQQDIDKGYLTQTRILIAADVFSDLTEMAQYFLEEGHKDPAASICGAALETGLRQILEIAGHPAKDGDRLQSLNEKCLGQKVYNKIRYNEVKSWTALRDHAAHGEYDAYNKDQVKLMIEGVRGLLSEHLR